MENKDKLNKKPLYKIGDIVVYEDRYFNKEKDSMLSVYQSKIITSYGLLETGDPKDEIGWMYHTEHTVEEGEDSLEEKDILYKL